MNGGNVSDAVRVSMYVCTWCVCMYLVCMYVPGMCACTCVCFFYYIAVKVCFIILALDVVFIR